MRSQNEKRSEGIFFEPMARRPVGIFYSFARAMSELDEGRESPEGGDAARENTTGRGEAGDGSAEALSAGGRKRLSGMYRNWFLDYASYVILDRAVPHIDDGLKPVQRRILFTMKEMDDGRWNKVASIVGRTMLLHPHGDASIYSALVGLGQKALTVDTQGNWGNVLTGDSAAAARYIEARLSKFALDVLFNDKTTKWKVSYDGRAQEPITLPVKFPLLLEQGAEGIAVGLSVKILPHNFNEICEAAIEYLEGKEEVKPLYPDFATGGLIDVANYRDGQRGGTVRVRAKIEKADKQTLVIRSIPYGKTAQSLIESILKAIEKGKIAARRVDNNTASEAEIVVHLVPGTSSDKAIDALYAFTDCEVQIGVCMCVIEDQKPCFLSVTEVLRHSCDRTKELLRRELEIKLGELKEELHLRSLEAIFIEERVYKDKEFEQAESVDKACEWIDHRLTPFYPGMLREVTKDDILKLLELKMGRILRFNRDKAEEKMHALREQIGQIESDLERVGEVAVRWFEMLKEKYGAERQRRTEIGRFDVIEASKVAEANLRLYVNREEGFIGTSLKKDEFLFQCSELDDVIIFYRDGTYKTIHARDKVFVGETERSKKEGKKAEIIHIGLFKKGDERTTYNVIYRDGAKGCCYQKRFNVRSLPREREYDLTQGKPGSKVLYFSANPNGEAEVVKVTLRPEARLKRITFDVDFRDLKIKGRAAAGNLVTKHNVMRIVLKAKGVSTLAEQELYFDWDTKRLNEDGHGKLLGSFGAEAQVLVIRKNGDFYTTSTSLQNHYEGDIAWIGKWEEETVWTAVVRVSDLGGFPYLKRFTLPKGNKPHNLIGEDGKGEGNEMLLLTSSSAPRLQIVYADKQREPLMVDAAGFVGVKSYKAKGRRLTIMDVKSVAEVEANEERVDGAADESEPEVTEGDE